ncbi:MAG: Pvc16 family protein [Nannocystaceae bacterium]
MSNSLAIAAVTAALRKRLADHLIAGLPASLPTSFDVNSARVTTHAPDRARADQKKVNQVNLHLFRVSPSAALRNLEGASGPGPLALELSYLLTAYAPADDEVPAHLMLAAALRILHERPVLGPAELRAAVAGADAAFAIEAVRLTLQPLSLEELNRLWGLYQTPARVSAAICASLVLLEPSLPPRSPMPALRRAIEARPELGLFPAIDRIDAPQGRDFALLGDTLELHGRRLGAESVKVRLDHPRLAQPIDLSPEPGSTALAVRVRIPGDPAALPAGPYTLSVLLRDGARERTSGARPLALAPEITAVPGSPLLRDGEGKVRVQIVVRPRIVAGQRVSILIGDRELPLSPPAGPTSALQAVIPAAPIGRQRLRVRVDGVDSDLLDRASDPPVFSAATEVVIQ